MNWELEKENLEKAILQDKISYEELGKRKNQEQNYLKDERLMNPNTLIKEQVKQ